MSKINPRQINVDKLKENILTGTTLEDYGITNAAPLQHSHNDTYYTETEIDTKLNTKANILHNHDDIYYTGTEVDAKLNTKEPVFTKNNAFNKNFGTAAGTVCQGNDSRLSDARAANGGNSDTVDGLHAHAGRNNEANKLVRTNSNGYIDVTYINSNTNSENGTVTNVIYDNGDGYLRKCTKEHLLNQLKALIASGELTVNTLTTTGTLNIPGGSIWIA